MKKEIRDLEIKIKLIRKILWGITFVKETDDILLMLVKLNSHYIGKLKDLEIEKKFKEIDEKKK